MAPRANWKGYLRIAEVVCPVALYTAASSSDRISFHLLNRDTGNRLRREFVDSDTGKPVEHDDQVKGFEVAKDDYVVLEPDEIAAVVPESDKTLDVTAFVKRDDVDDVYLDRPYYLAPADGTAQEAYALIREGLKKKGVAALAQAVLFRRVRTVLIYPDDAGLVASTLNFDHEVRSAKDAFDEVPTLKIKGEMLDLARHIIDTKRGAFDPTATEDRYEAALAELVKAKLEGRKIAPKKPAKADKVVDLMEALRMSAGAAAEAKPKPKPAKRAASGARKTAEPRRKAG